MSSIPRDGRGRVTQRMVDNLRLPDGKPEIVYWHPDVDGPGVRVGRRGASWMVMGRISVGEAGGRPKLRKVGLRKVGVVSLSDAEAEARRVMGLVALGDVLRRCRETKGNGYAPEVDRYFGDWLDKPMTELSGSLIERRYREIVEGTLEELGDFSSVLFDAVSGSMFRPPEQELTTPER